jgi:hypothetical protein
MTQHSIHLDHTSSEVDTRGGRPYIKPNSGGYDGCKWMTDIHF